ncbi:MAG: hypothetical protein NZ932_03965 [Candidatus Bathyarchaeota archaeon]|nr:hypothetical protein [Candidatus Bathyarchaeota archaeon]MDW8022375.1 hypothetical protein [Nitrososphaerota archaeon]
MSRQPTSPPLSLKLRKCASNIGALLEEYERLRFGDERWRKGEIAVAYVCEKCNYQLSDIEASKRAKKSEKGDFICIFCNQPLVARQVRLGTPPQITVVSSPRNIFYEPEEDENNETQTENNRKNKKAVNPVAQALINLGELDEQDVQTMELEKRYYLLVEVGLDERRDCSPLVQWLRKLASELSYILETRELYSPEIKAMYPEILTNIEVAIATCDQLAHLLGQQGGTLTKKQYDELLVKLLHFATIAQKAAEQLADYHEEFMGGATGPFAYESLEAKYVLETEEEKIKKLFKEELEGEEKQKGETKD